MSNSLSSLSIMQLTRGENKKVLPIYVHCTIWVWLERSAQDSAAALGCAEATPADRNFGRERPNLFSIPAKVAVASR